MLHECARTVADAMRCAELSGALESYCNRQNPGQARPGQIILSRNLNLIKMLMHYIFFCSSLLGLHFSTAVLKESDDGKYVINGDYVLSKTGLYRAAGTTFDYRRIDELKSNKNAGVTEWITSTGPTTESLNLMVLYCID